MNVFEASVNPALAIIFENLVDAVSSRVTTTLFPVNDLLNTLNNGKANLILQPLYTEGMILYYYHLLESTLTTDATVIHITFKSLDVFVAYGVMLMLYVSAS